mmetsp:Transcript_35236/g.99000  ORF Transcript_35236/g.99000 Transcript_35236/m.99000 type:complete len:375 (+) Transcript_35236:53-1177(+)
MGAGVVKLGSAPAGQPLASVEVFGKLPSGEVVHRINLLTGGYDSFRGARIITYGATVQGLVVPDHAGSLQDVVLGFDDLQGYLGRNPCFGGVPGRYANRIANGAFPLEGRTQKLDVNWKTHTLHGGSDNFSKKVWKIAEGPSVDTEGAYVTLALHSPAGDHGFPGALDARVTYRWTMSSELQMEFSATADRPTVVNLTNHSYFNLAGVGKASDVLQHEVELSADSITEVNDEAIPSGKLAPVSGTPFDFTKPQRVGERIGDVPGGGYDHNYCVNGDHTTGQERFVGRVREPTSGRCMECWATQPGVQFFTANADVVEGIVGKGAVVYPKHAGLCLETQHYPDSPNHPSFPSTALVPGRRYLEHVSYRFSSQAPF